VAIRSKRGTEKPIEIFIALFVILAVSLLVLRLFQTQIQGTTDDLSEYQAEQQRNQLKTTFEAQCRTVCSTAQNERGCSLDALVQVCIQNSNRILSGQYIDLNRDNRVNYDTESYGGVGVCENNIPCFLEISTCCGERLTPERCEELLCQRAEQLGYDGSSDRPNAEDIFEATGFLANNYNQCNPDNEQFAWWYPLSGTCPTP
jgi:hypothetical protein